MPTHIIPCGNPLTAAETAALDAWAAGRRGGGAWPELAEFWRRQWGADLVLDQDIIAGFTRDASNLPGRAEALARPRSARELAALFRLAFRLGVPCTISGGRSALTGSATPAGGLVVSTVNLTTPAPAVDAACGCVRAPAGIILEDLRRAVLAQTGGRLCYPVDPTSRADASVGGAVACNASGFTPGAAGTVRHWIAALDLVLPDGRQISARRGQYVSAAGVFILESPGSRDVWPVPRHPRAPIKNAGGPYSDPAGVMDFVDLVVGSEGIFGAVTACEMRLAPVPAGSLELFFSLPSEGAAVDLLDYLRARLPGGIGSLAALEYFGANCRRHMAHENRWFHGTDPVGLYLQQPLAAGDVVDAAAAWMDRLAAADCGVAAEAILLLDNERDRALFLEARHSLPANALEIVQRRGTFMLMTDALVPLDRFRAFLEFAHAALRAAGLDYLAFGHFGDCHLHFTILPERPQLERAAAVYDAIIAESARLGGVYSGEHGTGKRKHADFLACHGAAGADSVRRCKAAVDPANLFNRGNVCAMNLRLPYGRARLEVAAPFDQLEVIAPRFPPALPAPAAAFVEAVRRPLECRPLRELVAAGEKVAVLVPDITRPFPARQVLPWLFRELPELPREQVTIVVGTGSHRVCTPAELERLLGAGILARYPVVNHQAQNPATLAPAGRRPDGGTVFFNREYLAADRRIILGFIEPHFMAGFSGGFKAVMPGVADIDTILYYHRPEIIGDPRSTWGVLQGNPTQDLIRKLGALAPVDFCINVTLDRQHRLTGFFCGQPLAAHAAGCAAARAAAMIPCARRYPLVITTNGGYPLDQNLYQTVKGLSAAARLAADGGLVLAVSECADGFPAHGNFARLLWEHPSPQALLATVQAPGFSMFDQWEAQLLALILVRVRVALYSRLPAAELRRAHLEPVADPAAWLAAQAQRLGPGTPVAVLPDGPLTIPVLPP